MNCQSLMKVCAFLFFLVIGITTIYGQNTIVSGTVNDPQGGAISGATVRLISKSNGPERTATTTGDGTYQISQVVPGLYTIRVEATGFASIEAKDIEVLVNTPLTVDLAFKQVGNITETIEINAEERMLNTVDATIGNSFEGRKILDLPLSARDPVSLLTLQPGVTEGGHVNGVHSDQANITLDGIDVNEQQSGDPLFSVLRTTPDSLQEFRVTTTNPNADQGRSSGAQIALITRSGSNNLHGSLYEYHRNTITSANNWFNNKTGHYTASDFAVQTGAAKAGDQKVPRPQLIRNNFGGAIGGPIKKDKAFYFLTYEGFREAKQVSVVNVVPLPTLGQGMVRYYTAPGDNGEVISNQYGSCPAGTPAGVNCLTPAQIIEGYRASNKDRLDPGINPAALAVLADAARRYPANDSTTGDGLNTAGYRFNAKAPIRYDTLIGKFDVNLTDKQSIFARFNYQNDLITQVRQFPDAPAPETWVHPKGVALGHTWAITNSLVNNFRYGLTREAFTQLGDSRENAISFGDVYQPFAFSRTLRRTTPVNHFTDDMSLARGSHSLQFGTNIRLIKNSRISEGSSYDSAITNAFYYASSGAVLLTGSGNRPIFQNVSDGSANDLKDALAAVIGRFSQYSASLQYDKNGQLLPVGKGIAREFATQEYEGYWQDSWKVKRNLTLTYGLRWSTSTPVYETHGLQVKPVQNLGEYFETRVARANAGSPFNDPITVDIAGKANGKDGYYRQDWNNFGPSIAAAWSPSFKNSFLKGIFGDNKSTLRGGFRKNYDRMGSSLAVEFDLFSTLGYASTQTIPANAYNVTSRLAPAFTGFNQSIRTLRGLTIPSNITFPLQTPADEGQRIEQSLDESMTTPYNYSFNFSWGRELGKGYTLEASYVGRIGRNLITPRDILHLNNLRDPKSGMDWYTAIRQLINQREKNALINSVQAIPYFENLFPLLPGFFGRSGSATQTAYFLIARNCVNNAVNADGSCKQGDIGGLDITDYTSVQALLDDGFGYGDNLFFHPQYASLGAYSTIGTSDYHSLQVSLRKRFTPNFHFDFNYTYSHSLDIASGNESAGVITAGSSFIINPLNLKENRGNSDFDVRHLINANFGYNLPIGRGQHLFSNLNSVANTILGGWRLTGIFRWNTGFPIGDPYEIGRWATNWNVPSKGRQIKSLETSPTRTGDPNLFKDPVAAYQSYRNAYPGEAGDRNVLREPNYVRFDMGLQKEFKLTERIRSQFRWETFNVTNTQPFTTLSNRTLDADPYLGGSPNADFGKFTAIQTTPRVMQFALRIEF